MNNRWFAAALAMALTVVALPDADAKRLGGGKSIGMQRDAMPQRSAPTTPPQAPAAAPNANAVPPTGAAAATAAKPAAATAAAAAPAAAAKRSWMGPLAGLAAGLGIAALASALGFGEGLAQFMTILLVVIIGFVLVRWLLGALGARRQPTLATAGAGAGSGAGPSPGATTMQRRSVEATPPTLPSQAGGTSAPGSALRPITVGEAIAVRPSASGSLQDQLPAGFDLPGFERLAKMVFIRMQAAHDTADLDDLRQFTSPEMFAAVRLDLQERGGVATRTDVEHIEAELVDFSTDASRQVASVRYRGRVREDANAPAEAVDELWHLVRPLDDSRPWAIAGIQQVA